MCHKRGFEKGNFRYKDALSASGNRGVTRKYPHTPGIDAAGVVAHSDHEDFRQGDRVIVTGYDLGMNTAGGFGQFVRIPAAWAVPCPKGLSLKEAMALGTAGFTAAISIYKLTQNGVAPDQGEVLVTGATGGVGSIAVAILAKLGFSVATVSGKPEGQAFLKDLGARTFLSREEAVDKSGRPMLRSRWAGVIDTVGGDILATAIASTHYSGTVTCCGMVAGGDLPTSVFPFILRGVSLLGVDSAAFPAEVRQTLWQNLAGPWKIDGFDRLTTEIGLPELSDRIDQILQGRLTGRTVVRLKER
ncbi:MAG: YhdH/YhfP family quinone oxidoreductase [Desulfobacterales bacterium]|nr:YhdH/YhfP family quinone oxidoreductase [Desulfobacterales bacterium]